MDQKENLSHILRGKGFHTSLCRHSHFSPFTCKGAWTCLTTSEQEEHAESRGQIY